MTSKEDYSKLFFIFGETLDSVKDFLSDFENVFNNEEIVNEIPKVKLAYMAVIIINLEKLFGSSGNDKFGMCQFKNISSNEINLKIEEIEKTHKDIIDKIHANRSRIIAHTNENFHNLCFSDNERQKTKEGVKKVVKISGKKFNNDFFKMNKATKKGGERYTMEDLKNDLPEIRELIKKAEEILKEVSYSDYLKT